MEALLPLQYNCYITVGLQNLAILMLIPNLSTLKPYNLCCNQVKSIVTRSYEGKMFRSIQLSCMSMLQVNKKERKLQAL